MTPGHPSLAPVARAAGAANNTGALPEPTRAARPALRPAVFPASAPAPVSAPEQTPASDVGRATAGAGWPCTTCGALVSLELDVCSGCGAPFLARLAEDAGRHRTGAGLQILGIDRIPRTARLVLGIVSGVLLAILVPVLLALLG